MSPGRWDLMRRIREIPKAASQTKQQAFHAGNAHGSFEIARVLVRLDHAARFIVNANGAASEIRSTPR